MLAPLRSSSPGQEAPVAVLVLNYNGRRLLEECLPSVLASAEVSRHACRVVVIDNDSSDQSAEFLSQRFPTVEVVRRPNRGLCSFNDVLRNVPCRAAVLLNNDVKLDRGCIDALVEPLLLNERETVGSESMPRNWMTAPRCWRFDGSALEGFKTAVRWRWGLVQATALFPGHQAAHELAGPTASAGAAMAVDRSVFLELGGFDPLYLPGRIEDLDLCFRAYLAGYQALYVPQAKAYHRGMATFGPAFSVRGCDHLALRNTLLFQWKNLRQRRHIVRQIAGLWPRLVRDLIAAPWLDREARFPTWRALRDAWRRRSEIRRAQRSPAAMAREAQFFREFHPRVLRRAAKGVVAEPNRRLGVPPQPSERVLDRRHPISRWYLAPAANWIAGRLLQTAVRPWHITLAGAAIAVMAAASILLGQPAAAAVLILAAWFCDRLDGKLARRQGSLSPAGAWLDANVDELTDLGLHAALAMAAATTWQSIVPWGLFTAFVCGKYLFMYGLASDHQMNRQSPCSADMDETEQSDLPWLRRLYHLTGNADIRVHVLAALVAAGWWTVELLLVATYFNVRWMARYALVARRHATPPEPHAELASRVVQQPRELHVSAPKA